MQLSGSRGARRLARAIGQVAPAHSPSKASWDDRCGVPDRGASWPAARTAHIVEDWLKCLPPPSGKTTCGLGRPHKNCQYLRQVEETPENDKIRESPRERCAMRSFQLQLQTAREFVISRTFEKNFLHCQVNLFNRHSELLSVVTGKHRRGHKDFPPNQRQLLMCILWKTKTPQSVRLLLFILHPPFLFQKTHCSILRFLLRLRSCKFTGVAIWLEHLILTFACADFPCTIPGRFVLHFAQTKAFLQTIGTCGRIKRRGVHLQPQKLFTQDLYQEIVLVAEEH